MPVRARPEAKTRASDRLRFDWRQTNVRPQLVARYPCDLFDFGETFSGDLVPLDDGGSGNTEVMSDLGEHSALGANKFHSIIRHGLCLPKGSSYGNPDCLPLVALLASIYSAMDIGHRIAAARTLTGMSQTELAEVLKVSRGLVGQWESHKKKPGRDNLAKIAQATMVSMAYLMGTERIDQLTVTISDAEQIDLLRQFSRLNAVQRQNLRQLLGMTIEVRGHIEKHRRPTEGEGVS
jgi:transcriptional regulator with XRE-family HTH domain